MEVAGQVSRISDSNRFSLASVDSGDLSIVQHDENLLSASLDKRHISSTLKLRAKAAKLSQRNKSPVMGSQNKIWIEPTKVMKKSMKLQVETQHFNEGSQLKEESNF